MRKINYLRDLNEALRQCQGTREARRIISKMIRREKLFLALSNKVKFVGQIALGAIFMMALYAIIAIVFLMF